ncbi:hypothetical protein LCGC14_1873310 [marine sediment metagenome]|uniref:Uncharacterized protein n=1 Tax=marine sediment metagenome TaxID=412755 RepID=A0A0F9G4H0_9ZZZZ
MLTEKEKKEKFSVFVELNIELIAELVSKIQKVKRNNIIMYADIGTENTMYTKIENIYQKYHSNFFKLSSITLSF